MAADIRALTGVRGVAAALIVVHHFGDVHLFGGGHVAFFKIPHGYLAVDLFFVLSGFVIALTYRDAFGRGKIRSFGQFMLKRVARLYPAYFAIGLLYIAKIAVGLAGSATLAMFSWYDIVGNLLMLSGWGLQILPLIGVSWAASAEMASYLLVPVLLAITVRRGAVICLATAAITLLVIYGISQSGLGASGPLDVVNGDSQYPLLRAVAGFTLGMVVFRFAGMIDRWPMAVQDGLLVAILIGIVAAAGLGGDLLIYLLLIALVAVLSRDGRLAQLLFGNAVAYRLGMISYSAYLIHPLFVSFAVRAWRLSGQTESAYLAASLACFAAIWLLSDLSYRFIELPGRNWIVQFWRPQNNAPA